MTMLENGGERQPAAPEGLIKETTTQGFMKDVIEESKRQPVLIDFWAPWCGPCKQLTPVLEKVVKAAKGKVKLVKMNIDEHPAIPGQMGIQSIPAVIAFVNGQPADGFMGALPESQVAGLHRAGDQGQGRRRRDQGSAEGRRRGAGRGRRRKARPRSMRSPGRGPGQRPGARRPRALPMSRPASSSRRSRRSPWCRRPSATTPRSRPRARRSKSPSRRSSVGPVGELEQKVAANPLDHQARFDLAVALNAEGKRAGGGRSSDGDRQARPQMERRRRAQAARAVLRGLGPDRRSDRRRPQDAVVGPVCVIACLARPAHRTVSDHADERGLSRARRTCPRTFRCSRWPARCCCRAGRCRSTFSSRAIWRWSTTRCATATG